MEILCCPCCGHLGQVSLTQQEYADRFGQPPTLALPTGQAAAQPIPAAQQPRQPPGGQHRGGGGRRQQGQGPGQQRLGPGQQRLGDGEDENAPLCPVCLTNSVGKRRNGRWFDSCYSCG